MSRNDALIALVPELMPSTRALDKSKARYRTNDVSSALSVALEHPNGESAIDPVNVKRPVVREVRTEYSAPPVRHRPNFLLPGRTRSGLHPSGWSCPTTHLSLPGQQVGGASRRAGSGMAVTTSAPIRRLKLDTSIMRLAMQYSRSKQTKASMKAVNSHNVTGVSMFGAGRAEQSFNRMEQRAI